MNPRIKKALARLGYNFEKTETIVTDAVKHRARYNAIAIKTVDGRVFVAQAMGVSEQDAESKLVKMLERP